MPRRDPPAEHRFKKGQSGNPNGRPKKIPELDILLAEVMGDEQNGMTAAEAILRKLREKAIKGNERAAEILLDRTYGKSRQFLNLEGDTVKINVTKKPDGAAKKKNGNSKKA